MGERSVTPTIYQTILESMGEGIIFVDAEDRLAFINNTAENIRGIKAVNFIGRNLVSIHSPRTAERIDSLLTSFKNGSVHQSRRIIEVKGKYFENSYYPIRQADGLYLGTLLISRDITEKQLLKEENKLLREQMGLGDAFAGFMGTSPAILQIFKTISVVATIDSTILITGESGTGKELVAAAIQQQSERCNKPMIRVNCAALPEHLVESELFGHERGAFTGAISGIAANSNRPTAVPFSWMRWVTFPLMPRPNCCASSRKRQWFAWEESRRFRLMSVSSRQPTRLSRS